MKRICFTILLTSLLTGQVFAMTEVGIKGMVCSLCAQGLEKKFAASTTQKGVHVDLDKKLVHLHFAAGKELKDDEIKQLVKEAGYEATYIKR